APPAMRPPGPSAHPPFPLRPLPRSGRFWPDGSRAAGRPLGLAALLRSARRAAGQPQAEGAAERVGGGQRDAALAPHEAGEPVHPDAGAFPKAVEALAALANRLLELLDQAAPLALRPVLGLALLHGPSLSTLARYQHATHGVGDKSSSPAGTSTT